MMIKFRESIDEFSFSKFVRKSFIFVAYPGGRNLWINLKENWRSGIIVGMVYVPLALSFALASGATPNQGIQAAFFGGLASSLFQGSNFNIEGPTGALTTVLAQVTRTAGPEILPMIAFFAGIGALIVSLLNLNRYIMFIPKAVVEGFTLAIAVIIGLNQLNFIFGLQNLESQEHFYENVYHSLANLGDSNWWCFGFFVINLIPLMVLIRFFPNFPWPILFAAIGCLFGWLSKESYLGPILLPVLTDRYPEIPLVVATWPEFSSNTINSLSLSTAAGCVIIGVFEGLIAARIGDHFTHTRHNPRREVLGLAMANLACGLAGAMPVTTELAQTGLNLRSGATTRVSGIISSITIIVIYLAALPAFKYLALPTIAALLVMISLRMLNFRVFYELFKYSKMDLFIAVLTFVLCVFWETIYGIVIGVVISVFILADHLARAHHDLFIDEIIHKDENSEGQNSFSLPNGQKIRYVFSGSLTYVNNVKHQQRIEDLFESNPVSSLFILDFGEMHFIDVDGCGTLESILKSAKQANRTIKIENLRRKQFEMLSKFKWFSEYSELTIFNFKPKKSVVEKLRKEKEKEEAEIHEISNEKVFELA